MAPTDVVLGLLVVGALVGLAVLCGHLALRLARRSEQSDLHPGARAVPTRRPAAGRRLLEELRDGSLRIAMARLPLRRSAGQPRHRGPHRQTLR